MADDRIRMPSSEAGILRYSDEVTSKFPIKPEVVIVLAVALMIGAIILHILF